MDPERYLAELEPVGWKLGLERMRALCGALGEPQRSFESLHVVGTNGKTSVTLMCASLLTAGGRRTGACVSPHLRRWAERTRIEGAVIAEPAFAAAVAEVAAAIEEVEAEAPGGPAERVTQFEAAIAASLVAFRNAEVEVAVIEAGLGGRLDATNVISSRGTALTSVALDHTDWLGETVAEIAAEKLAVLEPGTPLIAGRLSPEIDAIAAAHAERLGSPYVRTWAGKEGAGTPAGEGGAGAAASAALPEALAPYLRRDAAVAIELTATVAPRLGPDATRAALSSLRLEGRVEMLAGDPPLIIDAAHNEEGAAALAEALAASAPRPRIACVSVLADKDARAFAAALGPELDRVICTAAMPGPAMGRPGAVALDPAELAAHFASAGVATEVVAEPAAAVRRASELAAEQGGLAICAGSNYLLRYAWTVRQDQSCSR